MRILQVFVYACFWAIALLLLAFGLVAQANATGRTPTTPAEANAASKAGATSYGSQNGNAWAVALPGHGSPSYAGNYSICVRGKGILWNAYWEWVPDPECVKLIAELDRMRAIPVPAAPVALLTEHCTPPAKAKSVAAAKKAGACR